MSKNFKQFSKTIWEKYEVVEEENKPTNPELWARAKSMAKKKFDVYPSAYANGWAAKWYKSKGGGWKSVSEAVAHDEYDGEADMAKNQLRRIVSHAQHFHDMLEDDMNMPEWVQSKITKAEDYISTAHDYMMSEMQEATYTAVHAKHGKATVQADSTYGAAKKAASQWNTGKKGTQGIDVHLHTDKPKAYSEDYDVTDISSHKDGYNAAKSGKKYSDNPHPKGSQAHLNWSKGHNQARANKTMGEDVVTYTHKDTGAKMKSKFITDVAAKNFATQLRSQQHKNIEHHKEEVDLEEGHFEITYTNPQFSKPQTHTMKAKSADHAQTKFLSYGNPYKVHSVKKVQKEDADVPALLKGFKTFEEGYYKDIATKKAEDERLAKQKKTNYPPHMDELLKKARAYDKKHPIPKNEAVTKTVKPGQGYKMEEVHPDTYKAQSVYDDAHAAATKKGHSEMEAHKHASAVMKSKHPGFSATRGEGQVYKEGVTEELKFKGLTAQDKKRMTKMNTVPTKPVKNKPGRQVAKHKDVVVHHHQGVGHVYKNHKHIASGDYDEGAGGYFMSKHGDKKGGQKFFDNEHKVAKHYAESIEESALTRVMGKLKDIETKKSFATGQSRIPTPEERRKQLSKKASVVKEAAKKKKMKPETFEADPELSSDIQLKTGQQ